MNLQEVDVLFSADEIQTKVREIGQRISADYRGEKLIVVGILKGAFIFMADLVRAIDLPVELDFMDVSSYGSSTISSGEVKIIKDLDYPVQDKHVLIIEDIVDTGLTLNYIVEILKKRGPRSVKICCLLDKPSRRQANIKPDYCGYSIEDNFVVGYGLDWDEKYRNYPAVCILKPSVYRKQGC